MMRPQNCALSRQFNLVAVHILRGAPAQIVHDSFAFIRGDK